MITQAICALLFGVLDFILAILPFNDISFSAAPLSSALDIIKSLAYFLPFGTVVAILSLIIAIMLFRIVVSIIKSIWQLLPFL